MIADESEDQRRPSPEALLAEARREGRGRLKVFLGAAPGVGKTYEMLSDAHERRQAGTDVVIGLVETHGRAETEAVMRGLELIPRRIIDHQGRPLTELDLDAVLARRPQLVLIDELAHNNAPGSRHPKRYQDIEEVLAAGIDVFTTVNIQHLESLSDIVAGFTRVRVRETLPDRIVEGADAIEIVDITPDELIDRLKAGKVYVPHEASRALTHFFSKANLTALRELALRRAAQTVDREVLEQVRAQALAGPWASGERLVVAVDDHPSAPDVIRAAKRLADGLRAPWTALHVETARDRQLTSSERDRLSTHMALASELGATVMTVPSGTVVHGLLDHARDTQVTQIVVGKAKRSRLFELTRGSVVDALVRGVAGVAVHVVSTGAAEGIEQQRSEGTGTFPLGQWQHHALAAAMVAAVTGLAYALFSSLHVSNVALLYLVPVVTAASLFGTVPSITAATASALAYNFFFLEPRYSFTIRDPENILTFFVLFGVGTVIAQLVARVRVQADIAASRARQNATLAGFSRALNTATGADAVAWAACNEAAQALDVHAVVLLPRDGDLVLAASHPPYDQLSLIDKAAADWCLTHGRSAGRGSDTLTGADWLFTPLMAGGVALGVLGFGRPDNRDLYRADQKPFVDAIVDQLSAALDRLRLTDEMSAVAQLQARDRARSALLSSVSHDLRTPLATVLGSITELKRRLGDPNASAELLTGLEEEALRINRLIGNLLDMSRLEAGALLVKAEPVDLVDAVASAEADVRRQLGGRSIALDIPANLPLVRLDPTLFHHCLINLLDNAAKYAEPATPIEILGQRTRDGVDLRVRDRGPSLPADVTARLFETFARLDGGDRVKAGSGLGLAIVKGFAEAMGLSVDAANRSDGVDGMVFTLHIPNTLVVSSRRGTTAA